jgi:hypothetical protein
VCVLLLYRVYNIFQHKREKNEKTKEIIQMLDCIKDANSSNLGFSVIMEVSHKHDNDSDNENSVDEFGRKSTSVHANSTNEN